MTELFFDRLHKLLAGNRYYNEFSDAVNHRLNQTIKERRLSRKRLNITKKSIMKSFESIHTDILSALKLNRSVSHKATYRHEQRDVQLNSHGLRQAMAEAATARNKIEALFDELDLLLATNYDRKTIGKEIEKEITLENKRPVSAIVEEQRPMTAIQEVEEYEGESEWE